MDFESPDVEKDFPGLYSSETVKKNNESDFSDDSHEKSFKSDLISKRKEKKDSKKDRGYAALEGESSQDEGDSKSPSKSKKTKSFKFPVKKSEKREKSREKEVKEKEKEAEKEKEKKKDKDKKEKSKLKDRKKSKPGDDGADVDEHAVFGAPLAKAVERLGCLDGVGIPLPVRHCIDCIHATSLLNEGLYKVASVKTKLVTLKKSYNMREPVSISDMDVSLASSLLITFLKELPDPILTPQLMPRFEEAGAVQDVAQRQEELSKLVNLLPDCNRTLLAWLIVHFDYVTQHEKHNKINAQSIAMTFSPVLQMSHRLLTAFLCHCKALFADTSIHKYVPPLAPGSTFPEGQRELDIELQKQEALLNQIHREMSEGFVSKTREEQLWEVQRIVTQLKRKLRSLQKCQESSLMQKSLDEETLGVDEGRKIKTRVKDEALSEKLPKKVDETAKATVIDHEKIHNVEESAQPTATASEIKTEPASNLTCTAAAATETSSAASHEKTPSPTITKNPLLPALPSDKPTLAERLEHISEAELRLQLENIELHNLHAKLQDRLDSERRLAEKFRIQIETYRGFIDSDSEFSSSGSTPACLSPEAEANLEQLIEQNQQLTVKKDELIRRIMEEREACIKLSVNINYLELMHKTT